MSQQCVFRLAPKVGIEIPAELSLAQKLKFVQERLEAGHGGARQIWESIGVYLGYAIAHYASFYELENMLILGRVTSGKGGEIILDGAKRCWQADFPELGQADRHPAAGRAEPPAGAVGRGCQPAGDYAPDSDT